MSDLEEKIKNISNELLAKWGKDRRTENLENTILKWLSPVSEEYEKNILIELLNNFNYYSRTTMNNCFVELHSNFVTCEPSHEYSIFTSIKSKDGHVNSSQELIIYYRNINEVNYSAVIDDLKVLIDKEEWDYVKNIVLIDDIIGTGKTIINYLKNYVEELKNKKVFILVIEVAEQAYDRLMDFGKENDLSIEIVYVNKFKKVFFEEHIFKNGEHEKARTVVENRELMLWNGKTDNVLGYQRTEALTAFVTNTPNNTLSSFWCESKYVEWYPLFPRRKDELPKWKKEHINQKKKKQNSANYMLKKIKQTERKC
ncbi:phosphoribosyltransferase [Clostridium formicaceticum]|uniref:PRTase-CE domain-containing protein n=1 Tax=Clostridium formicaceticum TaxID=1497 RepID=A0AAC9WI69_9CLOT|nr:phosphoribosyltransferase [Clostridium formicaceticum]AOY77882.1 hypothetical protein BJL90_19665 [Clostridium formicaceticum]ARE88500.1 hypothetical protein CLFO_29030 [Clostridium formicaceticum]